MNPLQSLADYESYIYTLKRRFPTIRRSTLVVVRRGASIAVLSGELELNGEYRIVVRERLSFIDGSNAIRGYGYEVWRDNQLLYWYDSQPHPHTAEIQSTHPHHKHVPPDIKHNRIPAPGLSFSRPNLPFLIKEVEDL